MVATTPVASAWARAAPLGTVNAADAPGRQTFVAEMVHLRRVA
jgi:hypothetical protein